MKFATFFTAAGISLCSIAAAPAFAGTDPFAAPAPVSKSGPIFASTVKTRFGLVQTSDYGSSTPPNRLFLNGKESSPSAVGNNHLLAISAFEDGDHDDVVLKSVGGSGCPTLYSVATVDSSGAHPTAFFGSCADASHISLSAAAHKIVMKMPVFKNGQNLKTSTIFEVGDGKITRDGKSVNASCPGNVCAG